MSLSVSRRTWEEASSPAAVRLARKYEQDWRDSETAHARPDLREFLTDAARTADEAGARLAILRADMSLRWESGEKTGAQWYLDHCGELGEDIIVALIYEEFCLREEDQDRPDPAEFLARFSRFAVPLGRVLEIHELVRSGASQLSLSSLSTRAGGESAGGKAFPEAGETIADFLLVEELGRGAFARVFLAKEQELADRPVALKVSRRGSHEPQTLARLQHTHIVPVHSHRIDAASALHLLCMPYFGRITLSRVLADPKLQNASSGAVLAEALDRLDPGSEFLGVSSAARMELSRRSYPRAIAWWCARLAEALAHAHDRGVLHRDIKPSNVLVTSDGMPMLLDFNLAQEPLPKDGKTSDKAILGGTIDYMAPEHLEALAEPSAHAVDGRADIYGLGVLLYEAVTGQRPFRSPRGSSVGETLTRAIDNRLRPLPRLRDQYSQIPAALEAVIRRCLAPAPLDRYQTATELATDLQAVADDLPLVAAREPWVNRATGWFRRRRRRLAMAAAIFLALATVAGSVLNFWNENKEIYNQALDEMAKGMAAEKSEEFATANIHYLAAAQVAERYSHNAWGALASIRNVADIGTFFKEQRKVLALPRSLDQIKVDAARKSKSAELHQITRQEADAFFQEAARLRFRLLLGEGNELVLVFQELQKALAPFRVLKNDDWTKSNPDLSFLDKPRRERLQDEVNELLFLWIAEIDESLDSASPAERSKMANNGDPVEKALQICKASLVWVEPREPWLALIDRLKTHRALPNDAPSAPVALPVDRIQALGLNVDQEKSALACFQRGMLAMRGSRLDRAIEWLRRATRLESDNHWYQFFLAYLEDRADSVDHALSHYTAALALRPQSPWARFSRAKIYRIKGRWDLALDDMKIALDLLSDRPEATRVHLEMGYIYHELGDFQAARHEYNSILRLDASGPFGPAARLNLANMDAESGSVELARREYDALLSEDFNDTSARLSRALLELRLGQAERAFLDLSTLLQREMRPKDTADALAARAMALLLLKRPAEAITDVTRAQHLRPGLAFERLRQRANVAAGRLDLLQFDQPEELAVLPLGGRRLASELQSTARGLEQLAQSRPDESVRASFTLAVILVAQGQYSAAVAAATRALELSPYSPRAYLIRARVHAFAGNNREAEADLLKGLAIQFNEPGLLELNGVLLARSGDYQGAIEQFESASVWGANDRIHIHKASAFDSLGRIEAAVREWSLALRRDPELPEAYLGRARAYVKLRQWEMAVADLEQAAAWAHSDPRIEVSILVAYARCLQQRPDRLPRFFDLTRRTAADFGTWWVVTRSRPPLTNPPPHSRSSARSSTP